MNLVVGGTGLVGGEVCRLLGESGRPVRALVRPTSDLEKIEKLKSAGVELVLGDLKDVASLDAACRGVTAVVSTASATLSGRADDSIESVDAQGQLNLVDAASTAGVQQFVYVSFPPAPEDFALQRAKRKVEGHLIGCGLTYTILQPCYFMEIWLSPLAGFDFANRIARIYGSGQNKVSWISYVDVARFAVASLDNRAAQNAVLRIGGPEALSLLEAVRIFEEVGGGTFTLEFVSEEALRARKAEARNSRDEALAALMLICARGEIIDRKPVVEAYSMELRTVRSYAASVFGAVEEEFAHWNI